jgi:hypothetical protein
MMTRQRLSQTAQNTQTQRLQPANFLFASNPRNELRGFYFGYFWFGYFSGESPSCAEGRSMSG